jgi:hypothetical protein
MAKLPISSFTVPRLKDLPKDVRARIKLVQEKTGFCSQCVPGACSTTG